MTANFLNNPGTIIDVRSPGEFKQGHIPTAVNIPLFTNDERAEVGTCYKHKGHHAAVRLGLKLASPKFPQFVEEADQLASPLKLYCWRGGMRSSSMAWLFETAGIKTTLLKGGYKAFRRWALQEQTAIFHLLRGLTGCGKTQRLHELKSEGKQVLDLEALAHHKGSSFGNLGMNPQPTQEQFENTIAWAMKDFDLNIPIWIEDESRMIGTCKIPDFLWAAMRQGQIHWLELPKNKRVERLLLEYGEFPANELIAATERLRKKLGGARTQEIVNELANNQKGKALELLLDYYDSTYAFSVTQSDSRSANLQNK